jgi:hypothetical protein
LAAARRRTLHLQEGENFTTKGTKDTKGALCAPSKAAFGRIMLAARHCRLGTFVSFVTLVVNFLALVRLLSPSKG